MGSQGRCSHCSQPFEVNPRARSSHSYCREAACQRERRRRAQQLRRSSGRRAREGRAEYMRRYRTSRPAYRKREAERAAEARRRQRRPAKARASTSGEGATAAQARASPRARTPDRGEAGLGPWRGVVEVIRGPGGPVVRVLTEAGFTVRLAAEAG